MKTNYTDLLELLEKLPNYYSISGIDTGKNITNKYEKILKNVMASNDGYRRNLAYWPGEAKEIEDLFHQSLYGKTKKEEKFKEANRKLRDDIEALASRIKHQEGYD